MIPMVGLSVYHVHSLIYHRSVVISGGRIIDEAYCKVITTTTEALRQLNVH